LTRVHLVRRTVLGAFVALILAQIATSSAFAATDFPAGYRAYHTYAEMVADLNAVVAAHPAIVRRFSIGKSYQGRDIWAAKISDHVTTDENEPEVMFDSLVHAREHITVEMNLYLLHLLADNYGTNTRITRLVNTREIYLVFMVNPDGGEYDIAGGVLHSWRKNRQPIPGTTRVGIDINRNFGYQWGCCNGSSGDPSKDNYRGPSAWYATETVVYRDFVRSRVIGGKQQLRMIISWHSSGKLILWPYGYTTAAVPSTMTLDDHRVLVALGKKAASLNGYTPEQGSALYISDGSQGDWAYHEQHIFQLTFELGPGGSPNFYPAGDRIGPLTTVNRSAVLYLLDQADCPYRAAGLAAQYCGGTTTVGLQTLIPAHLGPRLA
jgi:carboxypeptidase T